MSPTAQNTFPPFFLFPPPSEGDGRSHECCINPIHERDAASIYFDLVLLAKCFLLASFPSLASLHHVLMGPSDHARLASYYVLSCVIKSCISESRYIDEKICPGSWWNSHYQGFSCGSEKFLSRPPLPSSRLVVVSPHFLSSEDMANPKPSSIGFLCCCFPSSKFISVWKSANIRYTELAKSRLQVLCEIDCFFLLQLGFDRSRTTII